VALNELCDFCDAAAGAYQFVVGGHPARLTESGRQQLNDIRKQVAALEDSGLTGPEMVTSADALADQVRGVLQAELRSTDEEGHCADKGPGSKSGGCTTRATTTAARMPRPTKSTVDRHGPTSRRRR